MKELLIGFVIALIFGSFYNEQFYNNSSTQKQSEQASSLPAVDSSTFPREVLESKTPVLVDFYTDACPHCKNMLPVLADISSEYKDSLKLVRVDAESNPTLSTQYSITALPGFVIFKDGAAVESFAGEMAKSELESVLSKHGVSTSTVAKPQES